MYIIVRRETPDSKPEYYTGGGAWSTNPKAAQYFDGSRASILCENFTTKLGYRYSFTFLEVPRVPKVQ